MRNTFTPNIAPIAAMIGDPARAAMLLALMQGRALTVSELGQIAGLTKATASAHLRRLHDAGLITARADGRHKYMALAGPDVAATIEALMGLAQSLPGKQPPRTIRTGPRDPALRAARLCYDHLAGARGVQVFDHLLRCGHVKQTEQHLDLTEKGRAFLIGLGAELPLPGCRRTVLCRACLDWSERRSHLAGSAGRALLQALENNGWILRNPGHRALRITPKGASGFDRLFPAGIGTESLDLPSECP